MNKETIQKIKSVIESLMEQYGEEEVLEIMHWYYVNDGIFEA